MEARRIHVDHLGGGQRANRGSGADEIHVDAVIVRLAHPRRGVIGRPALLAAGVTARQIERRVRSGFLRPLLRGTYAVGHPHPHARLHAALLVAGHEAALSHDTSAALLEVLPRRPGPIHVTTPNHIRPRAGLVVHRARLDPSEITHLHGLTLTRALRTLHDVAATTTEADLRRAIDQAHAKRLVRPGDLHPPPGRPGATALPIALGAASGLTRSEAERLLVRLMRRARFAGFETNVVVAGHEVDVLFPEHGLVVEIDGYAFHSSPEAFQRDRRRDADLLATGYRTLRFTWRDLTERSEVVIARVAAALTRAPPPPPRAAG